MLNPARFTSVGELLATALSTYKTNVCLREYAREKLATEHAYVDVYRQVRSVLAALEGAGIEPGDHVAILMSNQPAWLIAASAILIRGAVVVPIDYKLGADDQLVLLAHSRAKLVFIEDVLLRRFDAAKPRPNAVIVGDTATDVGTRDGDQLWSAWLSHRSAHETLAPHPRRADDIACIVYSSGTGGTPKGCMLPHRAYLSQLAALMQLFPLRETSRVFSILPTNHAIDFMVGFLGPFMCGATIVHQRTLRPEFIVDTLKREHITHIALVPLLLRALLDGIDAQLQNKPAWQRAALTSLTQLNEKLTRSAPLPALSRTLLSPIHRAFGGALEVIFAGGAFVPPNDATRFYELGLPVAIGYGLTECCTVATLNDLRPFRADSVGAPVPSVRVRVTTEPSANFALGRDQATGEVGEVWISGPTLMRGYWQAPELTQETLIETDGETWLRTGDLGYFDAAGHLVLCGRAKNMIVTAGGKNVYPEDVEGALGHHEAWHELAVFSSSYLRGKTSSTDLMQEHLVLVVRAKDQGQATEILRERNKRLPEHKRLRAMRFVESAFPRTASMKVKREALRTAVQKESPASTSMDASATPTTQPHAVS